MVECGGPLCGIDVLLLVVLVVVWHGGAGDDCVRWCVVGGWVSGRVCGRRLGAGCGVGMVAVV